MILHLLMRLIHINVCCFMLQLMLFIIVDRYIFILDGRQLEGDRTLGYYDIQDCCTIHMTVRLRGGGM